jgi:hypothetical protein
VATASVAGAETGEFSSSKEGPKFKSVKIEKKD